MSFELITKAEKNDKKNTAFSFASSKWKQSWKHMKLEHMSYMSDYMTSECITSEKNEKFFLCLLSVERNN